MNQALFLFLRANRRHLADLMLAGLVVNTLALSLPLFSMLVYDRAVGNQIHDTLWALAIGMALLLGFELICRIARMTLVEQAASRWDTTLDERLMRGVLAAPLAQPLAVGLVLHRYRDLGAAREFLSASYLLPLADLPFLLLFALAGWFIGGPLVFIPLATGALLWAVTALLLHVSRHHQRAADRAHGRKINLLVETLTARESLGQPVAARLALEGFRQPAAACARSSTRSRVWSQLVQQVVPVGLGASAVLLLVAGVFQIEAQLLSVGGLISLTMLGGRMVGGMCALAPASTRWAEFRRALADMRAAVDLEAASPSAAEAAPFARSGDPALRAEGVQAHGLRVRYPGADRAVLDGIALRLGAGELVAVVGSSAAGKSTLLRVLAGQIAPESGSLIVAGRQIADDEQRRALAAAVACKPQDPTFLPGTVRQVVCPLAPAAADQAWEGDDAVLRSLRAAGFGRALELGGVGLNLSVGLAGQGLSGGQRQMLALARALHSDAGLLLLDEPTLGLDRASQETLIASLAALRGGGRCVVVATHTTELIRVCDRVLVLDAGRLVMDAPPARLLDGSAAGARPPAAARPTGGGPAAGSAAAPSAASTNAPVPDAALATSVTQDRSAALAAADNT
jgi:ABC-type bacteriocin/lantibiotic exporter with double-glycine peptidase domain